MRYLIRLFTLVLMFSLFSCGGDDTEIGPNEGIENSGDKDDKDDKDNKDDKEEGDKDNDKPVFSELDKAALMDLYASTDGENWTNHENWGTDADISEWYGVTINETKAAAASISVDLQNNNLQGSAKISDADNITSINLSNNSLTTVEINNEKLAALYVGQNVLSSIVYSNMLPNICVYDTWSVGDVVYPILTLMGDVEFSIWNGEITKPTAIDVQNKTIDINSAAELAWVSDACENDYNTYKGFKDWTIYQNCNINLNSKLWRPIGMDHEFEGKYDGKNNQIRKLFINTKSMTDDDDYEYAALFGDCEGATIKNISLMSGSIFNDMYDTYSAGICAKASDNTIISDCINYAEVHGRKYAGGVVGHITTGEVHSCSNFASVYCNGIAGGIMGYGKDVKITLCLNSGLIEANDIIAVDYLYAGGICGAHYDSRGTSISACVNTGHIRTTTILDQGNSYAGGIVGYAKGTMGLLSSTYAIITGCENRGNIVTAAYYYAGAGGIVGWGFVEISLCESVCDYVLASSLRPIHDLELIGVTPHASAGGIRGVSGGGITTGCFSSGDVKASSLAMIIVDDDRECTCTSAGNIDGNKESLGNTWNPLNNIVGTFKYNYIPII